MFSSFFIDIADFEWFYLQSFGVYLYKKAFKYK